MQFIVLIALSSACVPASDHVSGVGPTWTDSDGTSSDSAIESSRSPSTGTTPSLPSEQLDGSKSTPAQSASTELSGSSGTLPSTDVTATEDSDESSAGDWSACDGQVPVECLFDVATCPGEVGSCAWHRCQTDRQLRATIDRLDCLRTECGIEPTHDLECLEGWADLTLKCFDENCESLTPTACTMLGTGAWNECHR